MKITEVKDNNELVIENPLGDSFSGDDHIATIAQMNEIVVQLGAGASLDKLEFIYKPTFR